MRTSSGYVCKASWGKRMHQVQPRAWSAGLYNHGKARVKFFRMRYSMASTYRTTHVQSEERAMFRKQKQWKLTSLVACAG